MSIINILDFPITYKNTSVLCQPIRMCISTSNSKHGSFLYKINKNTYPKGKAPMQMYRVVPQKKKTRTLTYLQIKLIFFADPEAVCLGDGVW